MIDQDGIKNNFLELQKYIGDKFDHGIAPGRFYNPLLMQVCPIGAMVAAKANDSNVHKIISEYDYIVKETPGYAGYLEIDNDFLDGFWEGFDENNYIEDSELSKFGYLCGKAWREEFDGSHD